MFVIIRRLAGKRLGIRRIAKLRSYIRSNGVGFALTELERFVKLIEALGIAVLQDYPDSRELLEAMAKYNLPLVPRWLLIVIDINLFWIVLLLDPQGF
jgi:hypothetical protein